MECVINLLAVLYTFLFISGHKRISLMTSHFANVHQMTLSTLRMSMRTNEIKPTRIYLSQRSHFIVMLQGVNEICHTLGPA